MLPGDQGQHRAKAVVNSVNHANDYPDDMPTGVVMAQMLWE